jgi:HEAT repeat protein
MSSYAERVSTPRAKIRSTFDGVRMSLGMNLDIERMREQGDTAGLIHALDHANGEVRYQAADALGTLHDPSSAERLARALRDPDCGVRWKATEALVKLGSPALPHLLQALQDPAPDVRWRAALALGDTRHEEVVPALIRAFADPDPYVQGRAVVALSGFGSDAMYHLTQAARDSDHRIQSSAIRALGLSGESGLSVLDKILRDRPVDKAIIPALEEAFIDLGGQSVPSMVSLLGSGESPTLRALACRVLGRLRDIRVIEPLTQVLQSETDEQTRDDAKTAIRRLTAIAGQISK